MGLVNSAGIFGSETSALAAERKTFEDADYPRTVAIRSLKTRVSNARQFQSARFRELSCNRPCNFAKLSAALNPLDDIDALMTTKS